MKYIGAAILILVGILIISLTATVPGFSVVNTTTTNNSTIIYKQVSSYPAFTSLNNPAVFPSAISGMLIVTFATGYNFTNVSTASAIGTVTIVDYNTSNTVVNKYSTTWSINVEKSGGYYRIYASSSYTFNNPVQGSQDVYEVFWNSTLTYYAQTVGSNSYVNGIIIAKPVPNFFKFSSVIAYPGFFVAYNCSASWSPIGDPIKLTVTNPAPYINNEAFNIKIPSSQTSAHLKFVYVKYNASGDTLKNFKYAYLTFPWNTGNKQWIFKDTNITTYNNYPALYMYVNLTPGQYVINGYTIYSNGYKTLNLMEMSTEWTVTSTAVSIMNINFGLNQIVSYAIGSLLIVMGAVDAWRWHI
jgi:hypothetical protein